MRKRNRRREMVMLRMARQIKDRPPRNSLSEGLDSTGYVGCRIGQQIETKQNG
jgi:hypothetical protein